MGQPRSVELFRSLGVLSDMQQFARGLPPMRSYKLPGGTEPIRTWNLVEIAETTPDRPHVSAENGCNERADSDGVD